jgi:hypothetical protein
MLSCEIPPSSTLAKRLTGPGRAASSNDQTRFEDAIHPRDHRSFFKAAFTGADDIFVIAVGFHWAISSLP